ncbi:hypothetical protein [uncultured Phascolarctobacterium sp.]|uniref:hypothetical protein n=1 Tax=uncultured Phascolarctobacterium sp. TaxID=512296 RepID=UPI0025EF6D3A|nr:hypothetical protein [uncultured Phascolarctobacterium sp.]
MLIKVQETKNVYDIRLQGWDGNAWSVDLSNDLLTDMTYHDGMEMTQQEFSEYVEWLEADVERYNNGGSVEWYERNDEYPENDYEEFSVDVAFSYTDED